MKRRVNIVKNNILIKEESATEASMREIPSRREFRLFGICNNALMDVLRHFKNSKELRIQNTSHRRVVVCVGVCVCSAF